MVSLLEGVAQFEGFWVHWKLSFYQFEWIAAPCSSRLNFLGVVQKGIMHAIAGLNR